MSKLDWENGFKDQFHESWHLKMRGIIESAEVFEIYQKLKEESKRARIVPLSSDTFASFKVDLNNLRIIMFGQDVYPQVFNNKPASNGRAFCCENYGKISPSLSKLYDAIQDDCYKNVEIGDAKKELSLEYLENQGIMLTNASLTTVKDKPGKHEQLWEIFWQKVFLEILSTQNGLIIITFGKSAQKIVKKYSTPFIHYVLECEHPVAASYSNRDMIHNNVFSRANRILQENNGSSFKINWLKEQKSVYDEKGNYIIQPEDCAF